MANKLGRCLPKWHMAMSTGLRTRTGILKADHRGVLQGVCVTEKESNRERERDRVRGREGVKWTIACNAM